MDTTNWNAKGPFIVASLTIACAIAPAFALTPPPPVEGCYRSSNYAHVSAGRAHQNWLNAAANGSNQNMGFYNMFTITNLRRTSSNYYVVTASCP